MMDIFRQNTIVPILISVLCINLTNNTKIKVFTNVLFAVKYFIQNIIWTNVQSNKITIFDKLYFVYIIKININKNNSYTKNKTTAEDCMFHRRLHM